MTKNPFPGMNPFFEVHWRDAHTSLITYLRDALQERLPVDLVARAEEEVIAASRDGAKPTYRPDARIVEPWALQEPVGATLAPPPPTVLATEPIRVLLDDDTERWIEVHDTTGRLITVLELLSPSNKVESDDRDRYRRKRRVFINSGVNLVEIDLIRRGPSIFPGAVQAVLRQASVGYGVCVFRAAMPAAHEVYPIRLRERLPAIRVPLRPTDADVVLDLQALIDQCHERGRYHLLNYRLDLDPPFSTEEAAWVDQVLREGGLR